MPLCTVSSGSSLLTAHFDFSSTLCSSNAFNGTALVHLSSLLSSDSLPASICCLFDAYWSYSAEWGILCPRFNPSQLLTRISSCMWEACSFSGRICIPLTAAEQGVHYCGSAWNYSEFRAEKSGVGWNNQSVSGRGTQKHTGKIKIDAFCVWKLPLWQSAYGSVGVILLVLNYNGFFVFLILLRDIVVPVHLIIILILLVKVHCSCCHVQMTVAWLDVFKIFFKTMHFSKP